MLQKGSLVILAVLVLAAISGGLLVGVADAAAPGDPLYGLDQGMEAIRLNLTSNPESKARLEAQLAQERLEEIQELLARGDQEELQQVMGDYARPPEEASPVAEEPQSSAPKAQTTPDPEDEERSAYCDGLKSKHHPKGDKLAADYHASYEEIMTWFCAGYGFGEVELAYQIAQSADAPVTEIFALRASGAGWGEIMLAYDFKDTSLDEEPEDDAGEDNEEDQAERGAYCDGAATQNHPSGDKLAERYSASYEEIMDWFCQGYGFGEIDQAYQISQAADVPVATIFAQRTGGMGWGEIKQAYGLIGKDKPDKEKPAKDKDKGKPEKGQ